MCHIIALFPRASWLLENKTLKVANINHFTKFQPMGPRVDQRRGFPQHAACMCLKQMGKCPLLCFLSFALLTSPLHTQQGHLHLLTRLCWFCVGIWVCCGQSRKGQREEGGLQMEPFSRLVSICIFSSLHSAHFSPCKMSPPQLKKPELPSR